MIESPVSYQGGKCRIAADIINIIQPTGRFYDLCCGSGAVSIELINRGYDPFLIHMVDAGPWGLFWKSISDGSFSIVKMAEWCAKIPINKSEIKSFIADLSKQQPVDEDLVYVFLLLQAASFGGKAIWLKDGVWQNCSFRNHWQPTATSSRRSPVNPMMPMPDTLLKRLEGLISLKGIKVNCDSVENMVELIDLDSVRYLDPPYQNTTKYGGNINLDFVISKLSPIFVSEGKPLSATSYKISGERKKGGISGVRSKLNEEWLSLC